MPTIILIMERAMMMMTEEMMNKHSKIRFQCNAQGKFDDFCFYHFLMCLPSIQFFVYNNMLLLL